MRQRRICVNLRFASRVEPARSRMPSNVPLVTPWLAKREHRRVDEPIIIVFLGARAAAQGPDSYVRIGSGASFRWYHDRLVEFFGIMPKTFRRLNW